MSQPVPGLHEAQVLAVDEDQIWLGGLDAGASATLWHRTSEGWRAVWTQSGSRGFAGLAHDPRGTAFILKTRRHDRPGSTYTFHRAEATGTVGPWPVPLDSVTTLRACGGRYWALGAGGMMTSDDGLSWDDVRLPGTRNAILETLQCLPDGRVALLGPTSYALTGPTSSTAIDAAFPVAVLTGGTQFGQLDGHTVLRRADGASVSVEPAQPGLPQSAAVDGERMWLFRDRIGRDQPNTLDFLRSNDGGTTWSLERTFPSFTLAELSWVGADGSAWVVTNERPARVWRRAAD